MEGNLSLVHLLSLISFPFHRLLSLPWEQMHAYGAEVENFLATITSQGTSDWPRTSVSGTTLTACRSLPPLLS